MDDFSRLEHIGAAIIGTDFTNVKWPKKKEEQLEYIKMAQKLKNRLFQTNDKIKEIFDLLVEKFKKIPFTTANNIHQDIERAQTIQEKKNVIDRIQEMLRETSHEINRKIMLTSFPTLRTEQHKWIYKLLHHDDGKDDRIRLQHFMELIRVLLEKEWHKDEITKLLEDLNKRNSSRKKNTAIIQALTEILATRQKK